MGQLWAAVAFSKAPRTLLTFWSRCAASPSPLAHHLKPAPHPNPTTQMFAVTGATAVCAVCYVLPICIHLKLYLRGWGCGSGGGGSRRGKARRGGVVRRSGSQRSFSFEPRPVGGHAAGQGRGGEGPDTRWLLSADYHALSAALHALPSSALPALPSQRGQHAEVGLATSEGEEAEEGSTGGMLRGHRFTDLSLSRWLRGQSYDSFGGGADSTPATPVSPSSRPRDSMDVFREVLPVGGLSSNQDRLQDWPGGMAAASGAPSVTGREEEQQPGGAPFSGGPGAEAAAAAAEPAALPVGTLQAVPEAAPVVPDAHEALTRSAFSCATGSPYPRLADAGGGAAGLKAVLWHLLLPLAVLLFGLVSSGSALWLALAALRTALFRA